MPVYNTPKEYFYKSIDSILTQSFQDFELFILDDGTYTYDVNEFISSEFTTNKINIFNLKHSGVANTLNFGLMHAHGEYIARMDSDDVSVPDRFLIEKDFLDKYLDIALVGSWFRSIQDEKLLYKLKRVPSLHDLSFQNEICHPSVMFRRELFIKNNLFYDPSYSCEDYDLWSRVLRKYKIYNIQACLIYYRVWGENISINSQRMIVDSEKIKKNIINYLHRH